MSGTNLVEITADIVSAYVSNNEVISNELPALIEKVHATLSEVMDNAGFVGNEAHKPAVPIKQSVFDDYIICLEDGMQFKSLRRHLRSRYDISPEEYRAKWGLPADYPMVAPKYAEKRSMLAKQIGLGTSRAGTKKNKPSQVA